MHGDTQFIMDHTLGAQMPGGGMDQYNDAAYPQARIGDLLVRMPSLSPCVCMYADGRRQCVHNFHIFFHSLKDCENMNC